MTNPRGPLFVSYRRTKLPEISRLVHTLHEHGIPSWLDMDDLPHAPTPEHVRKVLKDDSTSGALLWLTRDVAESEFIRKIEAPIVFDRFDAGDGFYAVPVAAGGLSYENARQALEGTPSVRSLEGWNMERVPASATDMDLQRVSQTVLKHRLDALHRLLPSGAALECDFYARQAAPKGANAALCIDWSHRFHGQIAPSRHWHAHLLPALEFAAAEVSRRCPGRSIEVRGRPSLSAAYALGTAFATTRGVPVTWIQEDARRPPARWSLAAEGQDPNFELRAPVEYTASKNELAVLVSVTADVEPPFGRIHAGLGLRAALYVKPKKLPAHLNPAEAAFLAQQIMAQTKAALANLDPIRAVHWFLAGPVGLAFMLGQLSNTLPTRHFYELTHESGTDPGYVRALTMGAIPSSAPPAQASLVRRIWNRVARARQR